MTAAYNKILGNSSGLNTITKHLRMTTRSHTVIVRKDLLKQLLLASHMDRSSVFLIIIRKNTNYQIHDNYSLTLLTSTDSRNVKL